MIIRAIAAAVVATVASAQSPSPVPFPCAFNTTKGPNTACPTLGQPCSSSLLCATGTYCKALKVGQDGRSFSGVCSNTPDITEVSKASSFCLLWQVALSSLVAFPLLTSQVYGKPCTLGRDVPECVYNNPLALSPREPPSALKCIRAYDTDTAGTCRIGPNKHGDACNQDGECASGNCLRELRMCKGIDEGEQCIPSFPDPCQPDHYCQAQPGGAGVCSRVLSAGKTCPSSEACARGYYCAGATAAGTKKCVAPFSVPNYQNTTIAPWMCQSANALMVVKAATEVDSIYQCRPLNETSLVGRTCNPKLPAPLGYSCACAGAGNGFKLRTLGNLGMGARVTAWNNLFTCLMTAQGLMGEVCEFDSYDLTHVRYGSCAYYGCYPQYLKLVNATGSLVFNPPLAQFENFAQCELDASKAYYSNVASSVCLQLPNLENWRCAADISNDSLSVANTSAVIALVFIGIFILYVGHMVKYRKDNKQKLPCFKD
jgi:Dickkopf N-terminal cysteine-rich region